ncbi:hypothetical protein EV1_013208 [Malus domestica]
MPAALDLGGSERGEAMIVGQYGLGPDHFLGRGFDGPSDPAIGLEGGGDEDNGSRADVEEDDGPVLDLEAADAEGYGDNETGFHGEK